jgi:HK97 family phage major capsid protein
MLTLKELRQLRATKAARGKAALTELNAINAKGAEASTEELAKVATLETELQALESEVPDLDKQLAQREATERRQMLFATPALGGARSFDPDPAVTGGFKSMSHFATAVMAAQTGSLGGLGLEASATGYMQNQGSAGEGWLVPPSYSSQVAEIAFNEVDLFGMAQPESIAGMAAIKPKDETTPWGAAGVQAVWRSEASTMTASKLALTGEIMQLHELYAFCSATNEVLSDAGMLQNRLTTQAGRAISWAASDAVMWGNGAGKVTGFMTAPCLVTVAKESGQADTTVVVANLGKMLSRVLRAGGRPIWLANPDVIPQLIGLTIGNMPVWVPGQPGHAGQSLGRLHPGLSGRLHRTRPDPRHQGRPRLREHVGLLRRHQGRRRGLRLVHAPVLRPEPHGLPLDLPPGGPADPVRGGCGRPRLQHQVALRGPRQPALVAACRARGRALIGRTPSTSSGDRAHVARP